MVNPIMEAGMDRTNFNPNPRYNPCKTLPLASWIKVHAVPIMLTGEDVGLLAWMRVLIKSKGYPTP